MCLRLIHFALERVDRSSTVIRFWVTGVPYLEAKMLWLHIAELHIATARLVRTSHRIVAESTNGARAARSRPPTKPRTALATRPPPCVDDATPPKDQPMTDGYRQLAQRNIWATLPRQAPSRRQAESEVLE